MRSEAVNREASSGWPRRGFILSGRESWWKASRLPQSHCTTLPASLARNYGELGIAAAYFSDERQCVPSMVTPVAKTGGVSNGHCGFPGAGVFFALQGGGHRD